jgi:tetratricopeptide (TPR) repeat protein
VLLAQDRNAEAVEAFDDYLAKGGAPSAAVYQGRGTARFRLGAHQEAADDFGLALAARPPDKEKAALHLSRGRLYVTLSAARPALREFEATLALVPDSADAWRGCAQARVMLREPEQAVRAAERSVHDKPKDPGLWLDASRVFAQSAGLVAAGQRPEDQQRRLRAWYLDRAVVLLHQAVLRVAEGQRPKYWRDNVDKDKALDGLRELPEFAALAARFGNPNR